MRGVVGGGGGYRGYTKPYRQVTDFNQYAKLKAVVFENEVEKRG